MRNPFAKSKRSRSSKKQRRRRNIAVEMLHQRTLFAADLIWGTWVINGTDSADQISVSHADAGGDSSMLVATQNGEVIGQESVQDVRRIYVFGSGGDDSIKIAESISLPTFLYGQDGSDTIVGGSGNDYIRGGSGDDLLSGEVGNDTVFADLGNDVVDGGNGNDQIHGGSGNDWLSGDDGDDWIAGNSGNDTIQGGEDHDQLYGGIGHDWIAGNAGDDLVVGGWGRDTLLPGEDSDDVRGDWADRVTDTQIHNVNSLMQTLQRLADESDATGEHVRAVTMAIQDLLDSTELPPVETEEFLHKFESALEDGEVSLAEKVELFKSARSILHALELPPEKVDAVVDSIDALVVATNIDKADLAEVGSKLVAIRDEFQRIWFTEDQIASLTKLRTDLKMLADESEVTDEQLQKLTTDFVAILNSDFTIPEKELETFLGTIGSSLADGVLNGDEWAAIIADGIAVAGASNIPFWDLFSFGRSLSQVIVASNIDADDINLIIADIGGVVTAFLSDANESN